MTNNEKEYKQMTRQLHQMIHDLTDEDPAGDDLRDKMDTVWHQLTEEETERMKSYSAFLEFKREYDKALIPWPHGTFATFLYTLRSHLRGKIHARWHLKYHGPNQAVNNVTGTEITSLADQEKWLKEQIANAEKAAVYVAEFKAKYPDRAPSSWMTPLISEQWLRTARHLLGMP